MNHLVQYRLIHDSEVEAASELACRVFDEFAAAEESVAGCQEFHRYASPPALRGRHKTDCVTFVASRQGRIIGMLHLRDGKHIAMLFVEGVEQRQSIGSGLVLAAEEYALARQPPVTAITVASTPNAVDAYRKMGFVPVGKERVLKGLRFVPMVRKGYHSTGDTVVLSPLHHT
jgi:GNAT superfamily N-acetyltransferase